MSVLTKILGTKSDREIKSLLPIVKEIKDIAETLRDKSDEYLVERTNEIRSEIISARQKFEEDLSNNACFGLFKFSFSKRGDDYSFRRNSKLYFLAEYLC